MTLQCLSERFETHCLLASQLLLSPLSSFLCALQRPVMKSRALHHSSTRFLAPLVRLRTAGTGSSFLPFFSLRPCAPLSSLPPSLLFTIIPENLAATFNQSDAEIAKDPLRLDIALVDRAWHRITEVCRIKETFPHSNLRCPRLPHVFNSTHLRFYRVISCQLWITAQ